MQTRKQTTEATLMFLPLQDEMEGLDLEGKTVEETTDLLETPFKAVGVWVNSIISPTDECVPCY